MKRILAFAALGATLVVGVQAAQAHVRTSRYVSNTTWHTFTGVQPTGPIGHAQAVCLDATTPANCPAGATLYDHPGGGWSADLSSIPNALWIWAPGITKDTHPAELAQYFEATGLIDYVHGVVGSPWGNPSYIQPTYFAPAEFAEL